MSTEKKKKKKARNIAMEPSSLVAITPRESTAVEPNGTTADARTPFQNPSAFTASYLIQANPPTSSSSYTTEPLSNSIQNGTYTSIASSSSHIEPPATSIPNGTDNFIPPSPYETGIVRVLVGPTADQRVFLVHLGILSQAPLLSSKIRPATAEGGHDSIPLVDIDPVVFELVLRFLYTGKYQRCPYPSQIFPASEEHDANEWSSIDKVFEIHSLLYCFAQEYRMDELSALVQTNIENMTQVPYRNVLGVAKNVYPKLPKDDDDDMYREKFRHETRVAMKEDKNLIREPWILDVFKNEHGNLTVDLFTTLTEPLRCDGGTNNSEGSPWEEPPSPSRTGKGKEKIVHWDDEPANYSILEPASAEAEESGRSEPQETIADFPEAIDVEYPESSALDQETEPVLVEGPAGIAEVEDDRGNFLNSGGKKKIIKKKGKKGKGKKCNPAAVLEPEPEPVPEPEAPIEQWPFPFNDPQPEEPPAEEYIPEEHIADNHCRVEEEAPSLDINFSAAEPADEEPATPQSPSSAFMLGDADGPIMKGRYFIPSCSQRKLHLSSEIYWINCVRCRKELGSVARGLTVVKGDDRVEGGRGEGRKGTEKGGFQF